LLKILQFTFESSSCVSYCLESRNSCHVLVDFFSLRYKRPLLSYFLLIEKTTASFSLSKTIKLLTSTILSQYQNRLILTLKCYQKSISLFLLYQKWNKTETEKKKFSYYLSWGLVPERIFLFIVSMIHKSFLYIIFLSTQSKTKKKVQFDKSTTV
jgi:hypothetical protein